MKISGDNFEVELTGGQAKARIYLPEDKASVQLSVSLPGEKTQEAKEVLTKVNGILDVVKSTLNMVSKDIGQD